MKAVQIVKQGKEPQITINNIAKPEPKEHEVLINVSYVGVNPVDNLFAEGTINIIKPIQLPYTLGAEMVGTVVAKGHLVTDFEIGDVVMGAWEGTLAEYIAVPSSAITLLPKNLSEQDGATLSVALLTAAQILEKLQCKKGETIFIAGGTGAVGAMLVLLGKHKGLTMYVSGNQKEAANILKLGANRVFDYKSKEAIQIEEVVDYGVDMVGGNTTNVVQQLVKINGKVLTLKGMPTADFAKSLGLSWWRQWILALASYGVRRRARKRKQTYEFMWVAPNGEQLQDTLAILLQSDYKPAIDSIYPLEASETAFIKVKKGGLHGKVLVSIEK